MPPLLPSLPHRRFPHSEGGEDEKVESGRNKARVCCIILIAFSLLSCPIGERERVCVCVYYAGATLSLSLSLVSWRCCIDRHIMGCHVLIKHHVLVDTTVLSCCWSSSR